MYKPTIVFLLAALAGNGLAAERLRLDFGERLNAQELSKAVLARNPGVEALRAAVQAAQARIEPAGSLEDPMLSVGLAPATFDTDARGRIEISQTVPWPGTLEARADVARARTAAAAQDVETLKLRLRAQAFKAFADWYEVHRALAVNAAHRDILADLKAVAKANYAAGQAPLQDVLATEVEMARLDDARLQIQSRLAVARARVNGLLNRAPRVPLPAPARPDLPALAPPLAPLLAQLEQSHPALEELAQEQQVAAAQVRLAEKAFYPDFRFSAGYNSLWNQADLRPMVGVAINLPLDQGKREAAVDAAQAEVLRARWALEDARASLAAELAGAHARVVRTLTSLKLYRKRLVPLAERTLDATLSAYAGGDGDYQDVLNAERQSLQARLGLARTRAACLRALAELQRAAGTPLAALPRMQSEAALIQTRSTP